MTSFGDTLTRSDFQMLTRALRQGWETDPHVLVEAEAAALRVKLTSTQPREIRRADEFLRELEQHRLAMVASADRPALESLLETERERDRAAGLYNADCGAIAPGATD